jgi:hypothetical protein
MRAAQHVAMDNSFLIEIEIFIREGREVLEEKNKIGRKECGYPHSLRPKFYCLDFLLSFS